MELQLKTKNRIYKEAGIKDSYANWIAKEKELWQKKLQEGSTMETDFETYLNKRYEWLKQNGLLNADGLKEAGEKIFSAVKRETAEILKNKLEEKLEDKKDTEKENEALRKPVQKRILGLTPPVFYTIAGVAVLCIGAGIYFIFKNEKEK
jgi:PAB1-binding protein PBP1